MAITSAPAGQASATAPLAQLVQKVDAQTQATVRTIFNTLINWTATLPVNGFTDWLAGGLLTVRKSLFNQTAGVHSTQTANSPTLVTGKIDVIDPEGEGWKVELIDNAAHGVVALGTTTQANGIGSTKYTYTPGEGYTGDDQFVVKITPAESVRNIMHPFGVLDTRYYTVSVGDAAEAAKDTFNAEGADPKDNPETHLYLSNAAATITVKKQGVFNPHLAVTMTLPAETAAKSFAWMDSRGNMGSIPVDTMLVDDWGDYSKKAAENGVKPLLTFKYSDQGVDKAVFVEVGSVTKNADGSYTLAGDLKDGAPSQDGRVDTWDFAGKKYKAAFDNFLDSAGLNDCKTGTTCATVSAVGVLGTTTLSPSTFTQTGGHDYPQAETETTPDPASALQTNPGSMGPGTVDVGTGNGTQIVGNTGLQDLELTAMIPWGNDGSFIAATNLSQSSPTNNGIFLFTAGAPKGGEPTWTKTPLLQPAPDGMPPVWNAAVNVMAQYDQVLTDSTGTPIPTTYTGTVSGTTSLKLAVTSDVDPSSLIGQTIAGNGITPGTQINGWISSDLSGITYSVDNPIAATASPIAVTLPDKVATQPGLVIGLSDGSVYYWNSTGCMNATCVGPVSIPADSSTVIGGVDSPVSLAMSPDGQLYALGDNLTVIDSATNAITTTLGLSRPGPVPQVVVSPDGFYAYATTYLGNDTAGLAVIDTAQNTVSTYLALPQYTNADAVAISPDSTYGYIASGSNGSVYRFTTSSNPATDPPVLGTVIALPGAQPNPGYAGLAFSPDGATLYASYAQNGNVYVIDTATDAVTETIHIGGSPGALAVSPDGASLILAQTPNANGDVVLVIDTATNTVSNAIGVGSGPTGVAFNPNPGLPYAYVTNSNDSTVSIIDTQTWNVVGTFASGAGGDDTLGIAVLPDGLNVYLGNYDGGGDDYGTVPVFQVATPVEQGWAQLQASNGWGNGVGVNAITSLLNNQGFVVGLSDGTVATWDNPILADGTIVPNGVNDCSNGSPGGCWTVVSQPGSPMNSVNAIMASGQDAGFVVMGAAPGGDGWIGGFNGAAANFGPNGAYFDASTPTTLLPYDGTTLLAAIGDQAVIAEDGQAGINSVISAPSYASSLPDLSASSTGCATSYNSGSGAGCSGYVLTVQQAGGNPIRVGQILYGGPGLSSGTTITAQISDGEGNLCAPAGPGCNGGGTGVYLVDTAQLVAPGTPMSASDGTGFIVGFSNGAVSGFNNGLPQIADTTWNAANTTIMPWRDGFVVGLNNGAVMYWSPSNTAGSSPFVPNSGTPAMALDYPDASFTLTSQPIQGAGWTQLQGWNYDCNCIGWDQAVTSMVPMGDGFAVGLTSPTLAANGQVQLFSGFGALSTSSAFGYLQSTTDPTNTANNSGQPVTVTTLQALTPTNVFTQIAANDTITDLPTGTVGSVQQMVPIKQIIQDANGNRWNASSLVIGLTDNGIYSWGGSNFPPAPTDTTWKQQQAPAALPGQLDSGTLTSAWGFAADQTQAFGSITAPNAVGGSGDPIFQQSQLVNQAWCGTASQCASDGDFTPFAFNYPFGTDGVIYTLADEGPFAAQLNLTAKGYGYIFVPGGIWDKFVPDDYSAGLLIAVQGGPSVTFTPPAALTGPIKGTLKDSGSFTATQETEVGTFGETVGLDASLTAQINLKQTPDGVLTLAEALYTPGLLFTWNTYGNPDSLGMSYSSFDTTSIVSLSDLESYFDINGKATVTATITPYASVSYGLFTDVLDIFKLSVGYQNPITAKVSIPLSDPSNYSLDVTSQGFLTASAAFIPGITSDLSWKGKYQVYSV